MRVWPSLIRSSLEWGFPVSCLRYSVFKVIGTIYSPPLELGGFPDEVLRHRERISGVRHQSPIMLLVTNRRIFHLGIVLAIVLIIVGTTMITSTSGDHMGLGNTLRKIGTVVLLVLTITTVFRAGSFISYERTSMSSLSFPT
jgi:hypothetical protein